MMRDSEMGNHLLVYNADEASAPLEWNNNGFALAGAENNYSTIKIVGQNDASNEWVEKQDAALDEYLEAHVKEQISAETVALYKLFGAYIGNALHEPGEKIQPNILDVGCGVGRNVPLYIRALHHDVNYFGLDAIEVHTRRDYSFICSRLESLAQVKEFKNKFDMFIFGTSLDHFEDLDEVAQTIQYLAAPGSKVVFWIGLHDLALAASEEGASRLSWVFSGNSLWKILPRIIKFSFWSFPRVAFALLIRRYNLKRRQQIDDFHFWYFREQDLPALLSKFGEIRDITYVPGGGSVFVACEAPSSDDETS